MAKAHWHNSYEILYVRRGFGEQQINSKRFSFEKGSVTVICPRDVHMTISASEDGCEIDVLQFVGEYFGEREDMLRSLTSTVALPQSAQIESLFDRLQEFSHSSSVADSLMLSGTVFVLCGIISEYCKNMSVSVKKTKFAREACDAVNISEDIRLVSISQKFGYSPEHFSRRFHTEVGISYKDYCDGIRMQRFTKLFEEGELCLSEIAERLGYSDASSCIRAFKRVYGLTPGAYKRLKRGERY
jgi:AraC-like DNA-binding protein